MRVEFMGPQVRDRGSCNIRLGSADPAAKPGHSPVPNAGLQCEIYNHRAILAIWLDMSLKSRFSCIRYFSVFFTPHGASMYRGRRVCAAAAAAAVLIVCCVGVSAGPAQAGDDEDATVILFSGRDIWRNGVFLYGGLLTAPGGFEQDGFLFKMIYSLGAYSYNASNLGGAQVIAGEAIGAVLPGWRIKRGDVEAKFFFGPDFEYHPLWPDDPGNRLRGAAVGLRMAVELWYEPTPSSVIAADFSLTTIVGDNSGRLAYGWRMPDDAFGGFVVGPEIQYFGSYGYRHFRFGAHITGLKTDDAEWSGAAGWARDSEGRSGPYLRLGWLRRR